MTQPVVVVDLVKSNGSRHTAARVRGAQRFKLDMDQVSPLSAMPYVLNNSGQVVSMVVVVGHVDGGGGLGINVVGGPNEGVPDGAEVTNRRGPNDVVKDLELGTSVRLVSFAKLGIGKMVDGKDVNGLSLGPLRVIDHINAMCDERTVEVFESEALRSKRLFFFFKKKKKTKLDMAI